MSTQQGNKKGRDKLKTYFETGDRPTEDEFSQLIDSGINQEDDQVYVKDRATLNPKLGLGVEEPNEKLHVNGSIQVEDNIKGKDSRTGYLRISSAQNDDQDGSCMYMMRSDDGGSNSGGITFVAAGDGVKNGFEFTHKNQLSGQFEQSVRISGNGDVGIGTNTPNAKLVVQDDYKGPNYGAIRIEGPNGETGSNLRLGAHQDYSWIQSHDNKPLYLNKSGNNTILNPVLGTVGIGINSPDNTVRLHVHNGAGGKGIHTGLRLSTNAGSHKVLTSDSDGNAFWEDRENITNGLWRKGDNPNDIVNGNNGHVGIGTNSPTEKLTVHGNINIRMEDLVLFRVNDPNHGLGWFGSDYSNGFSRFFNGEHVNGPVLYGWNGGALGSNQAGSHAMALRWTRTNHVGVGTANPKERLQLGDRFVYHDGGSKILGYNFNYEGGQSKRLVNDGVGLLYLNGGNFHFKTADSGTANSVITGTRDALSILNNGNVGVGTSAASDRLSVNGNIRIGQMDDIYFRGGTDLNHGLGWFGDNHIGSKKFAGKAVDGPVLYGNNGGALGSKTYNHMNHSKIAVRWLDNGNVGIGQTSPRYLLHLGGLYDGINLAYKYMNSTKGSVGNYGGGHQNVKISVYAEGRILGTEFNAFSDARIKLIDEISSSQNDLEILKKIEITDYRHKDSVVEGDRKFKKVIGQQIREVFPQAVTLNTDVVPDIYKKAKVENDLLLLDDVLEIEGKIRIISEEGQAELYTVVEATDKGYKLDRKINDGEVFVFGREVEDFHVVDYDAIAMLNVSATQELAKKIEEQQEEIDSLKRKIEELAKYLKS